MRCMLEVIGEGILPVVLGIPNAGNWRLWSANDSFNYFVDDPVLTEVLAWGRVSRLDIGQHDEREIGFLDRRNRRLHLLPRRGDVLIAEDAPFRGHVVELSEQPRRLQSGLHDIEAVLISAIFHSAMVGGTVVVSPGSWNGRPETTQLQGGAGPAIVESAVHRLSDWDEHISLATTPPVHGSALWEVRPDTRAGWSEAVVPLHGDGLERAALLALDAASGWGGYDPEELALTFRGN